MIFVVDDDMVEQIVAAIREHVRTGKKATELF